MGNLLDYSLIITTKKRYRQIDTNINRKSFHTHPSLPPLPSPFSIYKIRGGEHSPPLPSYLAICRCTHDIKQVLWTPAFTYLQRYFFSDEDPKPFLHISLKFPSFAIRFSNSGNSNCMLLSNSFIKLVFLKRKPSEPNRYSISITNIFYVCHIWRIQCTDGSCWTETTRRSWKWRVSAHIDKYKWV